MIFFLISIFLFSKFIFYTFLYSTWKNRLLHKELRTLRKMFGWINQILVGSTIEYVYYTDNQIFGWAKKILRLIKFGWLYHYFGWSNQIQCLI